MNNETKLKIVVLGPISSGKTSMSNFLSDATENVSGEYRPTKGVRMLEFLAEGLKVKDKAFSKADVELWDCSGDLKYESCWPAILHKTDGVVFVYGSESSRRKNDLDSMYEFFVERSGFSEKNCIVMLNRFGTDADSGKMLNPLPNVKNITVDTEEKGAELRKNFNSFLSDLINKKNADDEMD